MKISLYHLLPRIHLFNPENDLALGLGCRHYTPPPHAAALHAAGALLPMVWAEEGDLIVTPPGMEAQAEWLRARYGFAGQPATPHSATTATQAEPWGWSRDAVRQFVNAGVSTAILPDDAMVERLRQLSHRQSSRAILEQLDGPWPLPEIVTDPARVVELERANPGCWLKTPWSCSGRGVMCASALGEAALLDRAAGIIHRQGSVIVERGLTGKTLDFAAIFHADGETVRFRGWSVFVAEQRGAYSGNIVAPQRVLEQMIAKKMREKSLPMTQLFAVTERLEAILADMLRGVYRGILGVDMMIHSGGLHPCVELNLRRTMGDVAIHLADRLRLESPHLLGWLHGTAPEGEALLPPDHGFALTLTPWCRAAESAASQQPGGC